MDVPLVAWLGHEWVETMVAMTVDHSVVVMGGRKVVELVKQWADLMGGMMAAWWVASMGLRRVVQWDWWSVEQRAGLLAVLMVECLVDWSEYDLAVLKAESWAG